MLLGQKSVGMMGKSKMTLQQFIKECGTQELAARALDVSQVTVNRWVKGHSEPSRKSKIKLKEHGVTI